MAVRSGNIGRSWLTGGVAFPSAATVMPRPTRHRDSADRCAERYPDPWAAIVLLLVGLAQNFVRYFRYGLDAPNQLNFDGQSPEVADRALDEMALKAFLNLSEGQTNAGVKRARTEGSCYAILKERA